MNTACLSKDVEAKQKRVVILRLLYSFDPKLSDLALSRLKKV
jgi:hypothetical protein